MKQFVFVLLSILVISISTLQASEIEEPFPLFAWSSSNVFLGQKFHSYENVDSSEITNLLLSTVRNSQVSSKYVNQDSQPEIIVIYYGSSELNAEEFKSVKNFFENSKSSLALPYSFSSDNEASVLSLAQYAETVIIGESNLSIENAKQSSLEKIIKEITSGSLNNGKVSLIIVDLSEMNNEAAQQTIGSLEVALKKSNSVSFVLSRSKSLDFSFHATKNVYLSMKETGEQPPYTSRWPAYIVEGILTSAMLIFFLLIAVIYTSCLQSPDQFESKKVANFVVG